jgi:hypothetical protein
MIEHFEKRESEYLKKEEEWKLEIAKMKEFVQTKVIEMERERLQNKRIFSFEGQLTFEKLRKEIATL